MTLFRIFGMTGFAATLLFAAAAKAQSDPPALPRIPGLDSRQITVSGVSAGGAMAVQLGVAYSGRVNGIGIIAAPPYLCAQGSLPRAVFTCLILGRARLDRWTGAAPGDSDCAPGPGKTLDARPMIDAAVALAGRGAIDPLAGLARQKVAELRGRCDLVVGSNASSAHAAFYRHFGADFHARALDRVGHTMPTDKAGQGSCDGDDDDYVSSCDFDAVGEIMRHTLPALAGSRSQASGEWMRFDQSRYIEDPQPGPDEAADEGGRKGAQSSARKRAGRAAQQLKDISLAAEGQLFVPAICSSQPCRLHVALHGCLQGVDNAMFDNFVRQSGYAEWASSIGVVVLFPRVTSLKPFERGFDPLSNPAGCWDWWGYTNGDGGDSLRYASRDAPQMRAIMKMVAALGGH